MLPAAFSGDVSGADLTFQASFELAWNVMDKTGKMWYLFTIRGAAESQIRRSVDQNFLEEPQMKRTKRLLALVLAMMMAFSMMAIPAAAHGEAVSPAGVVTRCPECGANTYEEIDELDGAPKIVFGCIYKEGRHEHPSTITYVRAKCSSCTYATNWGYRSTSYTCPWKDWAYA